MKVNKKEFTIDRSKWKCGGHGQYAKGFGETLLLNEEGYMCCLGQVSEQLGIDKSQLLNAAVPEELSVEDNILAIDNYPTSLTEIAISINDNPDITLIERERELKKLFNSHKLNLKFINKSVKYEEK